MTGGLDVEVKPLYTLKVEARDRDDPLLYDTASINIIVKDINDNSPFFTEVCYSMLNTHAMSTCSCFLLVKTFETCHSLFFCRFISHLT